MASTQPTIDLFRGWPSPSLLPTSALSTASQTTFSTPSISTPGMMYGPDPGYEPLRIHTAEWLTRFYQPREPVTSARICVTGGASQNLACILQVFTDPVYTRHVWMVAPTYYLACRIMDDAGFAGRLRAVPEDEEGLDVGFLRKRLEEEESRVDAEYGNHEPRYKPPRPWRKIYKHLIYATPTFSNPSTRIMSLRRRVELVRLARQYDALIVTDDVYDFLQWSTDPDSVPAQLATACVPRLVDVDRFLDGGPKDDWGNAVSNGSFSKLVGPGVRTGWAEGTEKFVYGLSQTGSSRSGGAPSQLTATFIDQLLPTNILDRHVRQVLQPAYARRYRCTIAAIKEHLLPLGVTLPSATTGTTVSGGIAGGYFIWVCLPDGMDAKEIAQRALQEENLRVAEGDLFRVEGDDDDTTDRPATAAAGCPHNDFGRYIRVCFAWEEEERLSEGIQRLARVIAR